MTSLNLASCAAPRVRRVLRPAVAVLLLGGAAAAFAQYKIVGPDGRVTYTDKPPTAADIRPDRNSGATTPATPGSGLPYATRQAMSRYPVSLYASRNCSPCDAARDALRRRGVPYTEFSVDTDADIDTLRSRFGSATLPVIAVGSQTMKGYLSADLQGYLDAAGYPAQSTLVGYRWPQPTPLAPPAPPAPRPDTATAAASAPQLPPPNRSGIQF